MNQQLLNHIAAKSLKNDAPKIAAGMTVRVSQKIKEGEKERIQNFEGLVIATNGSGVSASFTVRKIVGGVGVEKVLPLHSKNIVKIEIVKRAKIRRSKLYFMRELRGKAARMSETHIREVVMDDEKSKNAKVKTQNEKNDSEKVAAEKVDSEKPVAEKVETAEVEKPVAEKVESAPVEKSESDDSKKAE